MATILDPTGTPSVSYNVSGDAILSIVATGTNRATSSQIPSVCGHIIVLVTYDVLANGVILPTSSNIGDVVEVINIYGGTHQVYPPTTSDSINNGAAGNSIGISRALIRKTADHAWWSIP